MTSAYALTIVEPLPITAAMITACNVPETDYAAWAVGTTYAAGARVIVVATHTVYQSLVAGNVGNDPTLAVAGAPTTQWIVVKPTNKWACLDTSVSTQTAQTTSIVYTVVPGIAINVLAVLNVANATALRVQMVSTLYGTVYDTTVALYSTPPAADWWDWFLGQRAAPTQAVLRDLPSYPDCTITVTLTGGAGLAMGVLLMGQQVKFGYGIEYGAKVGIIDYTGKTTNTFGDTVVTKRAYANRASFDLNLVPSEVDSLNAYLASIRSIPCLFVGSAAYQSTVVFGFYKTFDILISYPERSICQFVIEGLT